MAATAHDLAALHTTLDRFWAAVDQAVAEPPDARWRQLLVTALAEIGANIVRHAYPAGTKPGSLRFRLRLYPDRVVASFADWGLAFAGPAEARGALEPDQLELPEGGYGLALARAAVDRLDYRRTPGGMNCWRLVKRF